MAATNIHDKALANGKKIQLPCGVRWFAIEVVRGSYYLNTGGDKVEHFVHMSPPALIRGWRDIEIEAAPNSTINVTWY